MFGRGVADLARMRRSSGSLVAPRISPASSGFTLLELAIVIFIMGLIMSLAVPYIGGFREEVLKSQARQLAGRTRYLYDEAAAQKVVMRLSFDIDHRGYFVSRLDPYSLKPVFVLDNGPWTGPVTLPSGIAVRDVSVEGIGTVNRGTISAQFYPDGYADATVIHMIDDKGVVLTLTLSPLTGDVTIQSGDLAPAAAMALAQ